ncbi:MAG: type II secretion system F family protein [Mycobacterium sp.]
MIPALLLAMAVLVHPSASGSRRRIIRRAVPAGPSRRGLAMVGAVSAAVVVVQLPMPAIVAAALAAGTGTLRYRRSRARRQARREGLALAGALELLTSELKAGAHPVSAFDIAATETAGTSAAVSSGLRSVAARAGLGADVAVGLQDVAKRSSLPQQWRRLAACWQLATDQGLPIGVLMRAAQLDIAERQRYAARVDAGMAGARATATILAALPVLGVGLGELMGAEPLTFLSGGAGSAVLVVGVLLVCVGVLWSGHITDRLPA